MKTVEQPAFGTSGTNLYFSEEMTHEHLVEITRERLGIFGNNVRFICMVGPARTGTTALQILASQDPSVFCGEFQPMKQLLRKGPESPSFRYDEFGIDGQPGAILFKETLGPARDIECTLDPVGILIEAGIHPKRISAVYILRHPHLSFLSWSRLIDADPAKYVLAQQTVVNCYHKYRGKLHACIPFYYALLADQPRPIIDTLFYLLDLETPRHLRFIPDLVRGKNRWNEGDTGYYWDHVIAPIVERGAFTYVARSLEKFSPVVTEALQEALDQYQAWRQLVHPQFL